MITTTHSHKHWTDEGGHVKPGATPQSRVCSAGSIPGTQRHAWRLAGQNRNTQRRPVAVTAIEEQKLRRRIHELARRHVRWGRRLV